MSGYFLNTSPCHWTTYTIRYTYIQYMNNRWLYSTFFHFFLKNIALQLIFSAHIISRYCSQKVQCVVQYIVQYPICCLHNKLRYRNWIDIVRSAWILTKMVGLLYPRFCSYFFPFGKLYCGYVYSTLYRLTVSLILITCL